MSAERRGNPFGWIFLGFVVGVLATFGAILFLTAGSGGYDESFEARTAADDAATAAMSTTSTSTNTSRRSEPEPVEAPVAAATADTTAPTRDRATPAVDAQMADDAAAAGMTSRATPN